MDRAPGEVSYLRGHRSRSLAHPRRALRAGRLSRSLARHRPVPARADWCSGPVPRARPARGRRTSVLRYTGAAGLSLDETGALTIDTPAGVLRDAAPVVYQEAGGTRVPVQSGYALDRTGHRIASRSPPAATTIAPRAHHRSRYPVHDVPRRRQRRERRGHRRGQRREYLHRRDDAVARLSDDLGAFRRTGSAKNFAEAFVTKLNASGSALVYSTFIGGSDMEFGRRIAIDAAGNAYITGQTKSSNFPVTGNAFDRTSTSRRTVRDVLPT